MLQSGPIGWEETVTAKVPPHRRKRSRLDGRHSLLASQHSPIQGNEQRISVNTILFDSQSLYLNSGVEGNALLWRKIAWLHSFLHERRQLFHVSQGSVFWVVQSVLDEPVFPVLHPRMLKANDLQSAFLHQLGQTGVGKGMEMWGKGKLV